MKPSLERLYKIFKLEVERGYDNRAVVGGLERLLDSWEPEARLGEFPEELIQAVDSRLRDYGHLSEASRAETLDGLWQRLVREADANPLSFPPPRPKQEPTQADSDLIPTDPQAEQKTVPVTPGAQERAEPPKPHRSGRSRTVAATEIEGQSPALNASVTILPGVGPGYAKNLERLKIRTLGDMLYFFPRRYIDYSQLLPINRLRFNQEVTVIGTLQSVETRARSGGNTKICEAILSDGTGALRLTWFNPWMAKRLHPGLQVSVAGKVDQYLGRLVITNPEVESIDQQQLSTNRIVPVYPLTANITEGWIRRVIGQVVSHWAPRVSDPLPESLRRSADLAELSEALLQIHFPDSWEKLKVAQERLAFDEILLFQLGVLDQKRAWQSQSARVFDTPDEWLEQIVQGLPFPLTGAQEHALGDVRHDLTSGHPMNRLLQGDVGSGKTIIAALAIAMVCRLTSQAAFMAPTSILAEQHYRNMLRFLAGSEMQPEPTNGDAIAPPLTPQQIRLLIGSTPEDEKSEIREGLANGTIKLVIGTHALIEDPVDFADLELAIVDEQHRFGVEQRAALRSKGTNPHLLVMTATPIPRSLALTVYGDLDLSIIDEMPPGRQEVGTFVLPPRERERAYRLIRSQVEEGHQAFMIYPLVEESDKSDALAAVEEHARLQSEIFPSLKLGLLHGRLTPEEKDEAMERFRRNDYQILVSTSVVEVGVDFPNATVMLIEGANRFGLAQLHQFRGRVGRGAEKSFCILIPQTADAIENERLQVMAQTNDGFVLAEQDLRQRGPGEFFGTRQSGYKDLQLTSLTDIHLIEKARRYAQELFEADPDLQNPDHRPLAEYVINFWSGIKGEIS
jgi:ATP-dependent DNA helicase RecG